MKRQRGLQQARSGRMTTRARPLRTSGRLSTMDEELAAQILGEIPRELKFIDQNLGYDAATNGWEVMDAVAGSLHPIAQGDTQSTRDGRLYHIDSIKVNISLTVTESESQTSPKNMYPMRVLLVLDKQTNGAVMDPTDLMNNGSAEKVMGHPFVEFVTRFQILADTGPFVLRPFIVSQGIANEFASQEVVKMFTFEHVFVKPLKVSCTGTSGAITDIQDNSLHLVVGSGSTDPKFGFTSRVNFYA